MLLGLHLFVGTLELPKFRSCGGGGGGCGCVVGWCVVSQATHSFGSSHSR